MTGPVGCPDCGQPITRQCAGHVQRARGGREAGHRCHQSARRGGTVCGAHGGAAPQVRAAAARRVAEARALAVYERYAPNGQHPVDVWAELAALVAEVRRFTDFTGSRVAALTAGDWRPDEPRAAAEVALYERALDRAGRLLTAAAALHLDDVERERAAEELWAHRRVAEVATAAIEAILRRLGHPDPRRDEHVAAVVAEEFARAAGGWHA